MVTISRRTDFFLWTSGWEGVRRVRIHGISLVQYAGSVYNMEVIKKLFLDPHTVQTLHSCIFSIDQPFGISSSNLGNTQYYTIT